MKNHMCDKYEWIHNDIKIEFSKPEIESHYYYPVQSEEEFTYFYYKIKVSYKKQMFFDNDDENDDVEKYVWKKLFKVYAYDFPALCWLKGALKYFMEISHDDKWQSNEWEIGTVWSYTENSMGFVSEDFYEITKVQSEKETLYYILSIGAGLDFQADTQVNTVRFKVDQKGMESLYKTVCEFIEYAISKHNQEEKKRKEKFNNSFVTVGNSIHQKEKYQFLSYKNDPNNEVLEEFYHLGDKVELQIANDRKIERISGTIIEISDDGFTLNNLKGVQGFKFEKEKTKNETISFKYNDLLYLSHTSDYSYERLNCNIETAEKCFIKSLCEEEIQEIKELSEEEFSKYYAWPFINTVWLMRDEHNLTQLEDVDMDEYKNTGFADSQINAFEHAKRALKRVRRKICQEVK